MNDMTYVFMIGSFAGVILILLIGCIVLAICDHYDQRLKRQILDRGKADDRVVKELQEVKGIIQNNKSFAQSPANKSGEGDTKSSYTPELNSMYWFWGCDNSLHPYIQFKTFRRDSMDLVNLMVGNYYQYKDRAYDNDIRAKMEKVRRSLE